LSVYIINTLADQARMKVTVILDKLISMWLSYFKILGINNRVNRLTKELTDGITDLLTCQLVDF